MARIQCKMCGGILDISEGMTAGICPYCESLTTFPKLNDAQTENLYRRAEHFRQKNDFDKAEAAYEAILDLNSEDPEAYWGLLLSRYGIEYVEDPATHERIPTCHRVQYESILADSDYRNAVRYALPSDRDIYEREAARIAEIQKDILQISAQEKPYDVFICYKEATDGGTRTKDSALAQDIYYRLTNQGLKVFFSRITLEGKLGQKYEPYIFAALNSAKVMLVIGTKREYFDAVWVKNEWSRFLALMKKDRSKLLIPCYKDMDAYDIPEELSMFQSQDMGQIGFLQDLLHGIMKVLNEQQKKSEETDSAESPVPAKTQKLPGSIVASPRPEEGQAVSSSTDANLDSAYTTKPKYDKGAIEEEHRPSKYWLVLLFFVLQTLFLHSFPFFFYIGITGIFFSVLSLALPVFYGKRLLGIRIFLSIVFLILMLIIICPKCYGTGKITCSQCDGTGKTPGLLWGTNPCSRCGGSGKVKCYHR